MLREPKEQRYIAVSFHLHLGSACPTPPFFIPTGYKFEPTSEPPPPEVDDEVRRREEEELQMVLEMSVRDKGGRGAWGEYTLASSSGAGASSSSAAAKPAPAAQSQAPVYGGYVPSASPAVSANAAPAPAPAPQAQTQPAYNVAASPAPSAKSYDSNIPIVTRVRALHTFEPTEAGELAFEKGDIIKVVDRNYKDWWRGQLKGRTGIFPVNYVVCLFDFLAWWLRRQILIATWCRNLSQNQQPLSLRKKRSRKLRCSLRRRTSTGY